LKPFVENFALTGVSSFFEKVEQLKKCHGCLLILDQPTTWFEIDATQNLAHCAKILQRFTKTTGNCLILLSTQELPECLGKVF
jgi:glutamate-1-semialdehyde aminotransferase